MAYRFLLEVPKTLAAEASVAVEQATDAQVLLVRDSHGLGFEDPYVDLTVAAHTLRVVDTLYGWFDGLGASRPDIRIVLHSGERLSIEGRDRGAMVAAIRRDQPWVERSIPKVGDHEEETFDPAFTEGADLCEGQTKATAIDAAGGNAPAAGAAKDPSWVGPGAVAVAEQGRSVRLRRLNHVAVRVADLAKAERFYAEFFGMELLGRARRDAADVYLPLDGTYRWDEAVRTGTEADVAYLGNGPLVLALHRAGRGARLEAGIVDHLSVAVDAATFALIKGEVLMRPLTVLRAGDAAVTFRDPFGLAWEVTVRGTATARTP
jgi:catechol 2,3-dioxygenase-like lactoylglutathione lyase family enzyme